MAALFRGYRAVGTKVPTYFIESTAPANVDDPPTLPTPPEQLTEIDPAIAIEEIAGHLSKANSPNLVIMVHGFNNSEAEVLEGYANASRAIETDPHITADDGLVCVGYRWTSEKMWQPIPGTFRALPSMLTWLFWSGVLLLLPYLIWMTIFGRDVCPILGHVFTISAWIVIGIVVAAALLRAIVYFRDAYRAASYAAPDLIEIVRHIDKRIIAADEGRVVAAKTVAADGDRVVAAETVTTDRDRTVATGIVAADKGSDAIRSAAKLHRNNSRVQLSFIGHSMGGFIVTNAIRVLSDLFADDASQRPSINAGVVNSSNAETVPSTIGNAFRLTRFVLASPDISAETLISNRANYLASSLRRFHEAYLFSNEGDEVLRQISTAANYFSFPTKDWRYGYRLGNLEVLSSRYGLIEEAATPVAKALRVGQYTLDEISKSKRRTW
jgi:hypothetical protein